MEKFVLVINKVSGASGWVANTAGLLLLFVICGDVAARYLFNISVPAVFELEWHLFSFIFLMGASYTLANDRHVRVDIFYQHYSVKKKAWINFLGIVFFLIPFCIVVIKSSIPYVQISWLMDEKSTDPGGLPFRYLIKGLIPLGFVLLMLQSVGTGLSCLAKILAKE